MKIPVAERTSTAVGAAATAETSATAKVNVNRSKNNNSSRDASNSRDHCNRWDSRKANGSNNSGHRVSSNSRGRRILSYWTQETARISHVEKSRAVACTKVKICTLYSTLSLINQLQIVATVQNQKNLVGLALYCSISSVGFLSGIFSPNRDDF